MRVFYWSRVEALRNYSAGKAVAFAETVEQAIDLIVAHYVGNDPFYDPDDEDDITTIKSERLRSELLGDKPKIWDNAVGFTFSGSE